MVERIQRKILNHIQNVIDSINCGVIFLYGESGSGKSHIIKELNCKYNDSVFIDFEQYNKFDKKNIPLLNVLKKSFKYGNDIKINTEIDDSFKNINNSSINITYEINTNIEDERMIKEETRMMFRSYTKPIIYLDAIENIIQGDRLFMEEMIEILVKNGKKVIITSRTLENKYNTNSFNINHFNQEEFDEFIKLNMPDSDSHILTIQNLCSTKDNYYNNITLSLMYSLYIEDKQDLFLLISDIKSELINVFGIGNSHMKNNRFISDMQERILKKILGNNEILTSFIQKVYILKTISKSILTKMEIEYTQQEWNEYEKFIKINGSNSRSEDREIEYTMHDNIFEILFSYYNNQISIICEDHVYSSLLKIVKFWTSKRSLLKIELGKFCDFITIFRNIVQVKESDESTSRLFFDLGYEFSGLGYYKEAIQNYEEAKKTIQEILKKNPDNDSFKLDLAGIYNNLGLILKEYGSSKYKESIENYEKSQIIYEEILEKNPENNIVKNNIARLFINKGVIFRRLGNYNIALENYSKSEIILQQLSQNNKENDNIKYDLGKVYLNRGIVLSTLSIFDESIENYEKSQKIYEVLLENNPDNELYKKDLGQLYGNMGLTLNNFGHIEKAIEYYEKSIKIYEEILKNNPDNYSIKNDLSLVYKNLGVALNDVGKHEQLIENYDKTIKTRQEMFKNNSNINYLRYYFLKLWNVFLKLLNIKDKNKLKKINQADGSVCQNNRDFKNTTSYIPRICDEKAGISNEISKRNN